MKPKRIFLLLLIGAAVILTVIWSTRGIVSKPIYAAAGTTQTHSHIKQYPGKELIKPSSHETVSSSTPINQCSVVASGKADIDVDTAEIYPTLNFNVMIFSSIPLGFLKT